MSDIETGLREIIATIVRAEVKAAVADATRVDQYLSTAAAARVADVSPFTIRRWIGAGKLTRHEAGRELRVSRIELERVLKGSPANNQVLSPEQLADKMWG
ncbi:MAG TPA: helix-turn-helix domain-containing protein [Kofleriaceae bacterium]|jgi:excisionase family DNA binding protein